MSDLLMFDFQEYYNRVADNLPDNCVVCEVGVANADSALYLAKRLCNQNKKFKMYMVDNMDYGGYEQIVTIYENIIKSGLGRSITVIPKDSITASKMFNDNSLDFCFIDASHLYEETKEDIKAWYAKVKDDCWLAGHDFFGHEEVRKAVEETIPFQIQRPTIDDPLTEQYQEFEPEQFLFTEDTTNHFGVWMCQKKFYYAIK